MNHSGLFQLEGFQRHNILQHNYILSLPDGTAVTALTCSCYSCCMGVTLYGHIKTAEQRTVIQQYGDWYTGR